jgi:hypothetical protein
LPHQGEKLVKNFVDRLSRLLANADTHILAAGAEHEREAISALAGRQGARKATGHTRDPVGAVGRMHVARKSQAEHKSHSRSPRFLNLGRGGLFSTS